MNLKNHTTPLPFQLSGDRGDNPALAAGTTYKFNLSSVPYVTRKMCNYLAGIVVTVLGFHATYDPGESDPAHLDGSDILRALFESAEIQQTMFGTPVSANHYLGKYFGLFEYIANGMQAYQAQPQPIGGTTSAGHHMALNFFIPLSALLGMKGHHTCQPVVCYDRAQFILRTAALTGIDHLTVDTASMSLKVSAIVVPEPELRLGPGTSFMQYTQTASSSGAIVAVDALGNSTTLEGAEPGAGIASFLWMGDGDRAYGGAQDVNTLEYVSLPFRDLQMTRHLDPLIADWMNACGAGDVPWNISENDHAAGDLAGGGHRAGYLYGASYPGAASMEYLAQGAEFLPLITPHKFLETSKLQVVQGTQSIGIKSSGSFSGQHIFTVLQYHSWTPAKQEEVLRKLVDCGVAKAVWGTNDLQPKLKVANKQPSGALNPEKTRFFAMTWEPKEKVNTPPSQS
jgi:hypothetical protein